jgi:23S rRNA (cytosine1962-C5)-methyltransferase
VRRLETSHRRARNLGRKLLILRLNPKPEKAAVSAELPTRVPDAGNDYELLDFGNGRKLERFGEVVLDRPSEAAEGVAMSRPAAWRGAMARYDRTRGEQGAWTPTNALPKEWDVCFSLDDSNSGNALSGRTSSRICFRLQASPFGHVGVFPEQQPNWRWISQQAAGRRTDLGRPLRVLNLFAYTGGSTLAAAAGGAEVVHVDAARNMVQRARRNAGLSALGERPVRWIAEDAVKFCQRELKRGNRYDAVILDPPTYGHGPKGEPWKIGEHLLPLLQLCGELTAEHRAFVLLTCHTPGIGSPELAAYLAEGIFGQCNQPNATGDLCLQTADGRRLSSGNFARWPA